MYWRRFAVSDIPIDDHAQFDRWVMDRWLEKEAILESYALNGRFPADEGHDSEGEPAMNGYDGSEVAQGAGFIETTVRLAHWYEIGHIFSVLASFALLANIGAKLWNLAVHGTLLGGG